MTGHEMAAEFAIRSERTLQIYERTGSDKLKIRPPPAFLEQIELNQLRLSARGNFNRRQAAAVHGHARAGFQTATACVRTHGQFDGFFRRRDFFDDARFFNNAGEHKTILQLTHPCRQQ